MAAPAPAAISTTAPTSTAPESAAPVWVAPPTEGSPGSSIAAATPDIDRHAEPTPSTHEHEGRQDPARCRGTVKWFNDGKGYGFIRGEDGQDAFVHRSAIANPDFRSLVQDQTVEYEVQQSAKGLSAVSVTPLEATPTRAAWPAGAGPRSAPRP